MTINCESQASPHWTFSEGHLLGNVYIIEDRLYITNINSSNAGIYECEGVNYAGENFIKQYEVHIMCKFCLCITMKAKFPGALHCNYT